MMDIAERMRAWIKTASCFGLDTIGKDCKAAAEEITALRAELEKCRKDAERYQWQPIETAPKDKSILAWIPHIGLPGAVYWHNGKWHWVTSGGWAGFPTCWMPLPYPHSGAIDAAMEQERAKESSS